MTTTATALLDSLDEATVNLITDAIVTAACTGSRAGGARRIDISAGTEVFVKVDRVVLCASNAWRITDATNPALVGMVLPQAARPGRYTSHAIDDNFTDLVEGR